MAPTKKRLKKADKIAAIRRLRTESLEQVAKAYNVTTHSIRNWEVEFGHLIAPPPTPLGARVETVPLPKTPEAPQDASSGPQPTEPTDGGYAAARAAALGEAPEPEQVETQPFGDAPPPPPQNELPPLPPEKTLLMLTELATMMSCRLVAARMKVKWTDDLKAAMELTPGEKQDLETYAPYAAPLMGMILVKYGPYIGAGIYGFVFWGALTDRFAKLKEMAPKKEEKSPDLKAVV